MVDRGTLWSFVGVLRQHWFAAMSGGFSVPFTAAAVYFDSKYAQSIFGFLALASLYFSAYQIWKSEHDKVLVLQETLNPTKIREIEARENETFELRRRNDAIEEERRANSPVGKQISRIMDSISTPRPLNIVVGHGGSFERVTAKWVHDGERTFYLKVENRDQHRPLANCKLDITNVTPTPDPDRGMPWTLKEGFSLAAGEHTFVKLAQYEEPVEASTSTWRKVLMVIFSHDPKNWLLLEIKEQILNIRATSPDSGYCDIKCKLWVDENWRFNIEKI